MSNQISDLRTHLFDTLKALRDPEKPMDVDRARAIADVSKQIIDSAKVEVDFAKVTGAASGSGFWGASPEARQIPAGARRDVMVPATSPLRRRMSDWLISGPFAKDATRLRFSEVLTMSRNAFPEATREDLAAALNELVVGERLTTQGTNGDLFYLRCEL